jgi:cell division protein DivIC|tara:strand:- start:32569 stop:32877 length:309 start_codon:yes stop_codon:yes gene_type:complete
LIKKIKRSKYYKLLTNIYLITITVFLIWIFFLDSNSVIVNFKLKKEINELKERKAELEQSIAIDKKIISSLQNPDSLERFAREKLFMKKDNEEIYIIEFLEK